MINPEKEQTRYMYILYTPVSVAVLFLLIFYVLLAFYLLINNHVNKHSKRVPALIYCLITLTFRGSLNMKRIDTNQKEFRLFGYRVPAGLVNSLGLLAIIVWIGVVFAFWLVLLGSEEVKFPSETCWQNSSMTSSDCEIITYYMISIDYVRALGGSGGLLVLTTVIIEGQMIVLMWMMRKSRNPKSKIRITWKFATITFELLPLLTEVIIFVAVVTWMVLWSLFSSEQHWIQFVSFVIAVFQSTYFPTLILYYTWAKRTRYCIAHDIEQGEVMTALNETRHATTMIDNEVCKLTKPLL